MNDKTLKWLIGIAGALCLFLFIAIRIQGMFNGILKEDVVEGYWDKTKYGEMYYFSMIKHFREDGLPPAQEKFELSSQQASVSESEILTFGDSFFEFSRLKQFPQRLSEDYQRKIHNVNEDFPLKYLAKNDYQDTTPKLVIYERTERYIPISFESEHAINHSGMSEVDLKRNPLAEIKDIIFYDNSDELFSVILKRSYLTTGLYSAIATLKFNLFGYISSLTPKYHLNRNQSWLFYHDQVNEEKTSFYYNHSDEELNRICDHMADLAEKLKSEYNMYLVYLPMPAKYTLYHGVINNDQYSGFLPDLYMGLENRGVKFVNIYDDFRSHQDTLYYRTDSHWNQTGLDLAYSKTIEYILSDPELKCFLKPRP